MAPHSANVTLHSQWPNLYFFYPVVNPGVHLPSIYIFLSLILYIRTSNHVHDYTLQSVGKLERERERRAMLLCVHGRLIDHPILIISHVYCCCLYIFLSLCVARGLSSFPRKEKSHRLFAFENRWPVPGPVQLLRPSRDA